MTPPPSLFALSHMHPHKHTQMHPHVLVLLRRSTRCLGMSGADSCNVRAPGRPLGHSGLCWRQLCEVRLTPISMKERGESIGP